MNCRVKRRILPESASGTRERILLHICCAPCATTVVQRLQEAGYAVYGFFSNPNIQPEREYYARLLEVQRLCSLWSIPLEIGEYDWDRWQAEVRGWEKEKEGGKRCLVCFRFRLAATARRAQELGIGTIATTLTLSPHKPVAIIHPIGREVCAELGLEFYAADWKKKDGFKQSLDKSRELNIYRQNYCGCKYSLKEREERMAQMAANPVPKPEPKCVTKAVELSKDRDEPARGTQPRAKWELTPLERKKKRDKKEKPWQRK